MAEKEVKIKVTTETDVKDIEDLESKLEELKSEKLELQIAADTAELDSVNSQIEETQEKLAELKADPTVDDSEIQSLEEELAELEARRIDLEISVNSSELDQAVSSMDQLDDKSQQVGSSIDGVGSALTGLAAAAGLEQMVTTADNINDSWNRLKLTFGNITDDMKADMNSAAAETGRSGGLIRDYFNTMGIAGVKNTDLLSQSFQALSGRAYQGKYSIESMENALKRMVMTGNAGDRQLQMLGITAEDLGRAMGVTGDEANKAFEALSQEDRLRVLTQAMGDGKQANEMYKNSFKGLKEQAEASLAGLVGAVGQAILPSIIPLLNLAKDAISTLTNAFKSLPEPVQRIIGGLGAVALAAVTLVGVLGAVGTIVKTVKSGIEALNGIMRIWEGVTKAVELAQAALNFVMALNPIVLVVAAIVALIAILVYLYYTNEDVRNAVNGLWDAMVNAWNTITSTVMAAVQGVITYLQNLYMNIVATGQNIWNNILSVLSFIASVPGRVGTYLSNIISRVVSFASNVISRFRTAATNAVNSFITGIASLPGRVYNELQRTLDRVIQWGSQIVSRLGQIAQQAWQAFVRGLGIGSPGYIQILTLNELANTAKRVPQVAQGIVSNLAKMASQAVDAWGTPSFQYGFENITKKDGVNIGNIEGNDNRNIIDLLNQLLDALNNKSNGEPNLTFNLYGDIDNEDRMQKFLEAVRRELNWNNATAGRTIDG